MKVESELELMKEGYGTLYEIENRMRRFVKVKMERKYGPNWQLIITKETRNKCTNTKFEQLHFHQLVSYYKIIPTLTYSIPSDVYPRLYQLNTIRNKIAHNYLISELELNQMIEIKSLLDKFLKI